MEYRKLGSTGLSVSTIAFGTSPLGGVFGSIDEADGIRSVHEAVDSGINLFDTAPLYGATHAEEVLGKALRQLPRERFLVETKVGRYANGVFDFSAARVRSSLDESLSRLGVEYADIVLCHDVEFVPLQQVIHEAIPELQKLRREGKLRHIGMSGLPLKIFTEILSQAPLDLILSYCRYTLFDSSLNKLIPLARSKGAGVINAAPLSMGLLANQGMLPGHPAPESVKAACAKAAEYCRSQGADIAALALQYALANSEVDTTVIGMRGTDELKANLRAAAQPLDPGLLAAVKEILKPIQDQSWPSGLRENQ